MTQTAKNKRKEKKEVKEKWYFLGWNDAINEVENEVEKKLKSISISIKKLKAKND